MREKLSGGLWVAAVAVLIAVAPLHAAEEFIILEGQEWAELIQSRGFDCREITKSWPGKEDAGTVVARIDCDYGAVSYCLAWREGEPVQITPYSPSLCGPENAA